MVGADVVLGRRQVDSGLAADRGVDLGDERRRHLDDGNASLVDGGAEAGEVADDAAAERDQGVVAADARERRAPRARAPPRPGSWRPRPLRPRPASSTGGRSSSTAAERGPVGDREPAAARARGSAESASWRTGPDEHRVGAGGESPPMRAARRGPRAGRRARAPPAPPSAPPAGRIAARQPRRAARAPRSGARTPSRSLASGRVEPEQRDHAVSLVDSAPDADRVAERLANPLALDRAAAERDDAAAIERGERRPLLELAEPPPRPRRRRSRRSTCPHRPRSARRRRPAARRGPTRSRARRSTCRRP